MPENKWRRPCARLVVLSLSVPAFFFSAITPARADASLVIGEINWAGSPLSTADEWIELWNVSDASLDLGGYSLLGASASDLTFTSSTIIVAKSAFLIANYAATDPKSALVVEPNVVTSSVSLPNDHMQILLRDPNGTVIDQAGDGSAPFAGASLPNKLSMIRLSSMSDGTQNASWMSASASSGFDPDVVENGTPGICDGCAEPAIVVPQTEPIVVEEPIIAPTTTEPIVTESTSTEPALAPIEEPLIIPLDEPTSTTGTEPTIATTTEPIIVIADPETPAPIVEETLPATTSTVAELAPVMEPLAEEPVQTTDATTTELIVTDATSTEAVLVAEPTIVVPATTTTESEILPPLMIHIHRILANPSSGAEWVEIDGLENEDVIRLLDWTLEDAVGTVFRFTSTTIPLMQHADDVLRIPLIGSHLNNDGDTVRIRTAEGTLVDEVTYGSLAKDETWPLPPVVTTPPPVVTTPPVTTVLAPLSPVAVVTTPAPVATTTFATLPPTIDATTTVLTAIAPPKTTKPKPAAITVPKIKPTSLAATKTIATTQKQMKQPTKKPAAPKTKPTSLAAAAPRLNLTGIVASIPGLLAQNRFVIHTNDGRGLLVRGNGKQPTPPFGALVRISGSLITNDQGTTLQMSAKDTWSLLETNQRVEPRTIDFFNPSKEDAWSLIHVTGTVLEAKNGLVRIDMDDATLAIKVRPVVKYRAERLKAGDVVSVTGLFEPKDDESFVYPRRADEIELLERAPSKSDASPQTSSSLPPWSPFGAAGITVAITQGYKHIRKLREQRHLENALAKASEDIKSLTS